MSFFRYKLEHIGDNERMDVDLNMKKVDDNNYWIALDCLRKHIKVIQFSEFIDASFSVSYFFSLALFVLLLAVSVTQILMHFDQLNEAVRYSSLFLSVLIQLFWQCWQAQCLLNHKYFNNRIMCDIYINIIHINIAFLICNNFRCQGYWYYTSTRCKKTLALIMIRSSKPCEITAMNLITFSIETFSSILYMPLYKKSTNLNFLIFFSFLLKGFTNVDVLFHRIAINALNY
ncbi:LOW QUALITY PROTEIN: odorant receptor 13a-like [Vespula squamosa]|uniref:Odorant receptor 13a-like n=1 Tax=Vespula squamosa TaxID=30214 RepID=A0ABD2B3J2_VESSQ